MVRTRRGATTGEEDAPSPLAHSLTLGSLPDDALASILGGLSAQDAARAEATSKAFRRLRPRVVAAQSRHVLREAKVRLTTVTDGQAYSASKIRQFHGSLCFRQSDAPRLTCVGTASDLSEDSPNGFRGKEPRGTQPLLATPFQRRTTTLSARRRRSSRRDRPRPGARGRRRGNFHIECPIHPGSSP